MTTTFPAPGSSAPGAPPPLRRPLTSQDGHPDPPAPPTTEPQPAGAGSRSHPPAGWSPTRPGLLVGLGLAVAALVVELTGRSRHHSS